MMGRSPLPIPLEHETGLMIPKSFKLQSADDVASLVGAVALAILAVIIVAVLYMGREVFVPVALAILLSFVLAPP